MSSTVELLGTACSNGSELLLFSSVFSFEEAQSTCNSFDGSLTRVENTQRFSDVENLLVNNRVTRAWIGK